MTTARVTWTDPDKREDDSPLSPDQIALISVLMSADNGNTYAEVGHAAAGQQSFDQELPGEGTYLFKTRAIDTQVPPRTSKDSNVASVTVEAPALAAPNPPGNVAVSLVPPAGSKSAPSKR